MRGAIESLRAFGAVFANPTLRRLQLAGIGSTLGLWAYGVCYLWAEDSALPTAAPARPGKPSRAPRPHPFALQASSLARALARLPEPAAGLAGQAVDDQLTLRLPLGNDQGRFA